MSQRIRIAAVGPKEQDDLDRLFLGRGGPKQCYCMIWRRPVDAGPRPMEPAERRQAMHDLIATHVPVGLLAYDGDEPIAWCAIGPRDTLRMNGQPPADGLDPIWAITCFYVRAGHRRIGVMRRLLARAISHARRSGAAAVEAYPVDPDAPSYRFAGFVPDFASAGFQPHGKVGIRRHAMRLVF